MNQLSKMIFAISLSLMAISGVIAKEIDYPSKKIRIIVPFPPGGSTDSAARKVAKELSEKLDQSVYVENKPGASGSIGANLIAKSKPDGYNLLYTITSFVQTPWIMKDIPYDVLKDFEPVAQLTTANGIFVVNTDLGVSSIQEFIDYAKDKPGELSIGSYGVGTTSHIFEAHLQNQYGLKLNHVPYAGGAALAKAIISQEVDASFADPGGLMPYLDNQEKHGFKVLGIVGTKEYEQLAGVKTFKEQGIKGFDTDGWSGFFAPKDTPSEVLDLLSKEIGEIQKDQDLDQMINNFGFVNTTKNHKKFKKLVDESYEVFGEIIKENNIKIE